jgi:hypothetical protein
MAHECHARGCHTHVLPSMFMCKRHWFMVPERLRDAVWAAYVPGQEVRKDPTMAYINVANKAIQAVYDRENP